MGMIRKSRFGTTEPLSSKKSLAILPFKILRSPPLIHVFCFDSFLSRVSREKQGPSKREIVEHMEYSGNLNVCKLNQHLQAVKLVKMSHPQENACYIRYSTVAGHQRINLLFLVMWGRDSWTPQTNLVRNTFFGSNKCFGLGLVLGRFVSFALLCSPFFFFLFPFCFFLFLFVPFWSFPPSFPVPLLSSFLSFLCFFHFLSFPFKNKSSCQIGSR